MRWIEWPPARGFDVLGSLFNSGPAWILFSFGALVTVVLLAMIMAVAVVARDRGRAFQREVEAEIERRRGGGQDTNQVALSTPWDSSTPTAWKVNTHGQ